MSEPTFPMNVLVASAVRTAVGRANKGTLKYTRPDDIAAVAMQGALDQVDWLKAEQIEDVILGCATPEAEQGLNIARNAVFAAKWPDTIPGETINRFCSSGLQAIAHVAQAIASGGMHCGLAGGVECTSMVPMGGHVLSLNPKLVDSYPEVYIGMGHTAERVATRFEVSREAQDEFAMGSQHKAIAAIKGDVSRMRSSRLRLGRLRAAR